jgi:hypothetical protein
MKRENDAARVADNVGRSYKSSSNQQRDRPVNRTGQGPGMCHRANRTLVAGNLGILGVYVGGLNKADEGD